MTKTCNTASGLRLVTARLLGATALAVSRALVVTALLAPSRKRTSRSHLLVVTASAVPNSPGTNVSPTARCSQIRYYQPTRILVVTASAVSSHLNECLADSEMQPNSLLPAHPHPRSDNFSRSQLAWNECLADSEMQPNSLLPAHPHPGSDGFSRSQLAWNECLADSEMQPNSLLPARSNRHYNTNVSNW
jgi:hypothetical protein